MSCSVDGCRERNDERTDRISLLLCRRHGLEVAELYREFVILAEDMRRGKAAKAAKAKELARQGNPGGNPVVYYARIGDYIKIGYTTRLQQRLRTLRADALLACEPGGPELERQRHTEFADARIDTRRENFQPTMELDAHVAHLRLEHGLPEWATRPRTSEIRRRQKEDA